MLSCLSNVSGVNAGPERACLVHQPPVAHLLRDNEFDIGVVATPVVNQMRHHAFTAT